MPRDDDRMSGTKTGRATPGRFVTWLSRSGVERAWVNALIAFFIGAVFAIFIKYLGIAGVEQNQFLLLAVATAVIAALAFGSVGRMLTRKRSGWLLALTVVPWGIVVVLATFVVFQRAGSFEPLNPTVPVAGGLVGVIAALLPYKGVPRILGIVAVALVVVAVVVLVAIAP